MRVLFITNYPSPYRVDFWNLLGQQVNLTVAFTAKPEAQKHRSPKWFNTDYSGFEAVFLKDEIKIGSLHVFRDIFPLLKSGFDHIFLGGYSSGTQMAAIEYLRLHKIPFILEADGGLIQNDSKLRFLVKRHFISAASAWMSSGKPTSEYFIHYGAIPEKIYQYPFTSLWQADLDQAKEISQHENQIIRHKLEIHEENVILYVGQMIHLKGVDVLLEAAKQFDENTGVYIVGGEPPEEYLTFVTSNHLEHVHFSGFKTKEELADYYRVADVFVMPTRGDIWGLVINEAMCYGLPIVSTNRCGAALELVEENVNGKIVPMEDANALTEAVKCILNGRENQMGINARNRIQNHTIEKMVEAHVRILQNYR